MHHTRLIVAVPLLLLTAWQNALAESPPPATAPATRSAATPPDPETINRYESLVALARTHIEKNDSDEAEKVLVKAIALNIPNLDEAHRTLADLYFSESKLQQAQALYRHLYSTTAHDDPRVIRRLAETCIRLNQSADGEILLNTHILNTAPEDAQALNLLALSQFNQFNFDLAIAICNRILVKDPNDTNAYYQRAIARLHSNTDLPLAIAEFRRLSREYPDTVTYQVAAARACAVDGQFDEAQKIYAQLVEKYPTYEPIRNEYILKLLAWSESEKQIDRARATAAEKKLLALKPARILDDILRTTVAAYPDQPVWVVYWSKHLTIDGHPEDAELVLVRCFDKMPRNPIISAAYFEYLLTRKKNALVIDLANALLDAQPANPQMLMLRGRALLAENRKSDAIKDFENALQLTPPDSSAAYPILVQITQILGQADAAALLQKKLKASPDNPLLTLGLAQCMNLDKRSAEAIKLLEPLATSKLPGMLRPHVLSQLAYACLLAKDHQKAADLYAKIIAEQPANWDATNNLAWILANNLSRPKEARIPAERMASAIFGEQITIDAAQRARMLDTVGLVRYLDADYAGAENALLASIKAQENHFARFHLAQLHAFQKKPALARENATKALAVAPSDAPERAAIESFLQSLPQ